MNAYLRGVGVALVTPFGKNGDIDYAVLDRLVDYVIDGGVDYIVALGTTAETPTLENNERDEVLNRIKQRNADRLPLVVGIGGNSTAAVVKAVSSCDLSGVNAILSVTPYYNRPSQRGIYEHYKAVAEASPVPVVLYNVPSRTGVNMLSETTLRLAHDVKNIVAIKEACGDLKQFEALLAGRPEDFYVISGDDAMALPLINMGGHGVISVAANAFPAPIVRMCAEAFVGNTDTAEMEWGRMAAMVKALFEEGNPTGVKAALYAKSMINNVLRLPLVESSAELLSKIEALITEHGL